MQSFLEHYLLNWKQNIIVSKIVLTYCEKSCSSDWEDFVDVEKEQKEKITNLSLHCLPSKFLDLLPHHQTDRSQQVEIPTCCEVHTQIDFFCKNLTNCSSSNENSKPQLMLICILQFCNLQKISCFFSCCRLENCFSSTICPRRMFCETNTLFFFFCNKAQYIYQDSKLL